MREPRIISSSSRFLFIDLLRGWSVFVMIETHVVNALLRPDIKSQNVFTVLSFFNGLVAPSFLFCAGIAAAIMLSRKWTAMISLNKIFWRYCMRLLFIFIVAYSLHLPFFSFAKMMQLTDPKGWSTWYQVDILQVIALTLFVTVVLAVILRHKTIFYPVMLVVSLAVVFLAPFIRDMDVSSWPPWLSQYVSTQVKSQFPLFPWAAFLTGGVLTGGYFVWMKQHTHERKVVRWMLIAALLMGAAALALEFLPVRIYLNHSFFRSSPEFFFVRFSLILLALVALWHHASDRTTAGNSVVSLFGQESLLVYVVHLLIVYGYTYEFSFIRMFGPTLNYLQCAALFVVLTGVMYAMAYVWHALKSWNKPVANTVEFAVLAAVVVTFLLKQT